jgi:hypothetical protein
MAEQVKLPVVIDFSNKDIPIVFHRLESNPNKSFILTDDIIPFLSKRFWNNIKVTGVNPDTLFFDFAESFRRKFQLLITIFTKLLLNICKVAKSHAPQTLYGFLVQNI